MKNKENRKCSKSIRAKSLACWRCNEQCRNLDQATGNRSEPEHPEKCIDQCDRTPSCVYSSNASSEVERDCDEFVATNCGNATDVSECVNDLKDVEDSKCPAAHRMKVTTCMTCKDTCVQPPGGRMSPSCLMNCNQTETCMSVNAKDEFTLINCNVWITRSCDNFTDVQECLEMNLMEDDGCPEPLRGQIARCRKCEKQCKAADASAYESDRTTKEKCEERCEKSDVCSGSAKNITCASCVRNFCKNSMMFDCFLTAVTGRCRGICIPSGKACEDCKDNCAE